MSLTIDQNENLYFKLSDLQQKLRESEEERSKLERTCDILLRAFREEETLHYKALNNKYERFLEDCSLRKKRNEIILRSLCRVENKAKALFAKTERLKLSKNRFISYVKEREKEPPSPKVLPSSSSLQKNTNRDDVTSKFVHWKTSQIADYIVDSEPHTFSKQEESFLTKINNDNESKRSEVDENLYKFLIEKYDQLSTNRDNVTTQDVNKSENHQEQACQRDNEGSISHRTSRETEQTRDTPKKLSLEESDRVNTRSLWRTKSIWKTYCEDDGGEDDILKNEKAHDVNIKKEARVMEPFEDRIKEKSKNGEVAEASLGEVEVRDLEEVKVLRERGMVKHQESIEKLKTVMEDYNINEDQDLRKSYVVKTYEYRDDVKLEPKVIEKDEIEENEKMEDNFKKSDEVGKSPKVLKSFIPDQDTEKFGFEQEPGRDVSGLNENNSNDCLPNSAEEAYPMGLDGVDYQNETYPESYYEQPVREHSYTSIASNVILEEDESEVEAEQQETSDESFQNLSFNRRPFQLGKEDVRQEEIVRSSNEWTDLEGQKNKFPDNQSTKAMDSVPSGHSLESEQVFKPHGDQDLNKHVSQVTRNSQSQDYDFKILGNVESSTVMKTGHSPVGSDSSKSEKEKSSRENKLEKTSKGLTNFTQSNLAQLLESDSESFQIEHGDLASANEDSDFDFSFRQNLS